MADAPQEPETQVEVPETQEVEQVLDERGRPTIRTKEIVRKLETALQNGFTIDKACEVSGIGRRTYYDWLKQDEEFTAQMERAKNWAVERARQVVVTAIQNGDSGVARWYLERKASDEFGNKNKLEGVIKQENTLTAMTDEQILEMQTRMAKAMGFSLDNAAGGITDETYVEESAKKDGEIQTEDKS